MPTSRHAVVVHSTPLPEAITGRPFLGSEAVAAGISRRTLESKRFRRLFQGVYVESSVPDSIFVRCAAARLVLPDDSAFSHHTAAALRRLPVPDSPVLHVLVPSGTRVRVAGIQTHRGLESAELREVCGLPVTVISRTFLDLAGVLSLEDLVVFADAALFRGWTTTADLEAAVQSVRSVERRRGIRVAREALPLLEPRAESPMETRLRLILVFAGLPRPVANEDVRDEYGQWLGRPDLSYPAQRIAIQYEGGHHRQDRRQYEQDILRDEVLADRSWVVLKFTAVDVYRRPATVVERVRYHLVQRGGLTAKGA